MNGAAQRGIIVPGNTSRGGQSATSQSIRERDHISFLDALPGVVGSDHLLTDPDLLRTYETDWMGRRLGHSSAVIRPSSADEVAAALLICREQRLPVVTQGGNTGLVGGGVPVSGEVVLSTCRLVDAPVLDFDSAQVTLSAGTTVAQAQAFAGRNGFELGIDLASRDTATIGGIVATNAGGLRVPRFGHVRRQLVGIEAVLGDGSRVERMSGLLKDNSGYDLPSLLCGSEGTLAVITAARLRVWPMARQRVTAVLGLLDLAACVRAVRLLRDVLPGLESAEVIFAEGIEHVVALGARRAFPEPHPVELLIEATERSDETSLLDEVVQALGTAEVADVSIATDATARAALWERRERHPEIVGRLGGVALKLDTAVPLAALPAYEQHIRAAIADADPHAQLVLYGHIADGNLHVNVAAAADRSDMVRDAVFRVVHAYRGSISAEHGIGRDKTDHLRWTHSADEISALAAIKGALDPARILNPGVILPQASMGETPASVPMPVHA